MYMSAVLVEVGMFYKSVHHFLFQVWRACNANIGTKCQWCIQYWSKMSVTHEIFGRCEIVVADDVYIRNRSSNNIAAQTYITY